MDLPQWAQIGEFMSAFSVLLTLISIAVPIRVNTRAWRSAGAQQTHDTLIHTHRERAGNAQRNPMSLRSTQTIDSPREDKVDQYYAVGWGSMVFIQRWPYIIRPPSESSDC